MKSKWIIPVVLFIVLVTVYAVRGVYQSRIGLELLQVGEIQEVSATQGVLIKKENVNTVSITGATEIYVNDGDRVSNKEILAMHYSDTEDEGLKIELSDINKKINAIQKSNSGNDTFVSDTVQMENELSGYIDDIIGFTLKNNFESLSEYKYKIDAIATQKAHAKGDTVTTIKETLVNLQSRKAEIEKELGRTENVVAANMAGIYIEGRDGFEEELTPDNYNTLSPEKVDEIIKKGKNGNIIDDEEKTYTYKIVDNFSYYLAVNLGEELGHDIKEGDSATIRFSDFSSSNISADVVYVSEPDEEKIRTVVVKCDNYVEGLMSKRVVNVDFVKKSVSGYKVKIEHLHTVENAVGLYIKRGAVMKFIPVNIVYSNEEEAIVESLDKNTSIKSYDEVVVSAPDYYNGKVIVSQ